MSMGFRFFSCILGLSLLLIGNSANAYTYIARPYSGNEIPLGPVKISLNSSGQKLPCFVHHGRHYLLGQKGMYYSIMIRNQTHQRLEVVVSVDGRDVISGVRDSSYQRRGYILNPHQYVDINGFRTSQSHVAAFRFTHIGQSYAMRRGDSWFRVGNIHVAIFRERQPIAYIPRRPLEQRSKRHHRDSAPRSAPRSSEQQSPIGGRAKGGRALPPSGSSDRESQRSSRVPAPYRRPYIPPPPQPNRPNMGTEYGQQTYAPAQYTTFTRSTYYPSYRLTIQYNDCAGFINSGIYSRWCPRYPRYPRPHRRPLYAPPQTQDRFAPPPQ